MGFKAYFETEEKARENFINRYIVGKLPEEIRREDGKRARDIVYLYGGVDKDALAILMFATDKGRFDEFAGKLMAFYRDTLRTVDVQARRTKTSQKMQRVNAFLDSCYKELHVGLEEKVISLESFKRSR